MNNQLISNITRFTYLLNNILYLKTSIVIKIIIIITQKNILNLFKNNIFHIFFTFKRLARILKTNVYLLT